ncbi:hypothetical protein [Nostoc sp. UHCC 0252]|uniref:hypothetical protein n=1 Tax=Nostoc sp. UHCC 0252 TaxID=3110241 RepID=UPI002B21BA04|nr:hypothetical protein [Nostoc sp. UHCC 0252]MEA5602250.1 hypothetical protein [Nostoc sp. UHCC 0252]
MLITSSVLPVGSKTGVGWGATAPLRFPDLKHVAFEEQNPTLSKLCWVTLKFNLTYNSS